MTKLSYFLRKTEVAFAFYVLSLGAVRCIQKVYDLDVEAHRLYGTDLEGAIARFRRTTDYGKILDDRLKDLAWAVKDMTRLGMFYRIADFEKEAEEAALKIPKFELIPVDTSDKLTDVEILDRHLKVYHRRPTKMRNEMRTRGFQIAGEIIDSCIQALANDPGVVAIVKKPERSPMDEPPRDGLANIGNEVLRAKDKQKRFKIETAKSRNAKKSKPKVQAKPKSRAHSKGKEIMVQSRPNVRKGKNKNVKGKGKKGNVTAYPLA